MGDVIWEGSVCRGCKKTVTYTGDAKATAKMLAQCGSFTVACPECGVPAELTWDTTRGEMRYAKPPTYRKETEVAGEFREADSVEWIGGPEAAHPSRWLNSLMPMEALIVAGDDGLERRGPRGRFRIVVEFTPDE